MITFIITSLFILAVIYHFVHQHQLLEDHELELSAARRKNYDQGFSKGWAQCHQALSLRMENTEALRLQARRSQLAMEAANARLKYFDDVLPGMDAVPDLVFTACSCCSGSVKGRFQHRARTKAAARSERDAQSADMAQTQMPADDGSDLQQLVDADDAAWDQLAAESAVLLNSEQALPPYYQNANITKQQKSSSDS